MATLREIDQLALPEQEYTKIATDADNTHQQLEDQIHLAPFLREYDTLRRAFTKSHESEKRILKKCKQLHEDSMQLARKADEAELVAQEDAHDAATLASQLAKSEAASAASAAKQAEVRERIASEQAELVQLRATVDGAAGASARQEGELREGLAERDETAREAEALAAKVVASRVDIGELTERVRALEGEKELAERAAAELQADIAAKRAEVDKERGRKERLERELGGVRASVEKRAQEVKDKAARMHAGQEELGRLELAVREQKQGTERKLKEVDGLTTRVSKLTTELEDQLKVNDTIATDSEMRRAELRELQQQAASLSDEEARVAKLGEAVRRKLARTAEDLEGSEGRRDRLKRDVVGAEGALNAERRERQAELKVLDDLEREHAILATSTRRAKGATAQQASYLKVADNTQRNLEAEVSSYRAQTAALARTIGQLARERTAYAEQAERAQDELAATLSDLKERDLAILKVQKLIVEEDAKLKLKQTLYESLRSERNLYSRNLIEAQEEIAEMRRKFKVMTFQIEQLKDEIQSKDLAIVREHLEHMKLLKDCDALRETVEGVKRSREQQREEEGSKVEELRKLEAIIRQAEAERERHRKDLETATSERDVLDAQLMKRNDELARLYERIKQQQGALQRGERAYNQVVRDAAAAKKEYNKLRAELQLQRSSTTGIGLLRRERFVLQRSVFHEKAKCRALTEELDQMMNVHRWRNLESSDPKTYVMIKKSHALQKELILRTEELVQKDQAIQQKEKMHIQLSSILARMPGPEVAEQITMYQQSLAEKQKQLRAMTTELESSRKEVSALRIEQEAVGQHLGQIKRHYFAERQRERRSQHMRERYGAGGDDDDDDDDDAPVAFGGVPGGSGIRAVYAREPGSADSADDGIGRGFGEPLLGEEPADGGGGVTEPGDGPSDEGSSGGGGGEDGER